MRKIRYDMPSQKWLADDGTEHIHKGPKGLAVSDEWQDADGQWLKVAEVKVEQGIEIVRCLTI